MAFVPLKALANVVQIGRFGAATAKGLSEAAKKRRSKRTQARTADIVGTAKKGKKLKPREPQRDQIAPQSRRIQRGKQVKT